jgi:hypothetical protein
LFALEFFKKVNVGQQKDNRVMARDAKKSTVTGTSPADEKQVNRLVTYAVKHAVPAGKFFLLFFKRGERKYNISVSGGQVVQKSASRAEIIGGAMPA